MKKSECDLVLYSRDVLSVRKRSPREPGQRRIESEVLLLCPAPFETMLCL